MGGERGRSGKVKVAMYKDAVDIGIKVPCRWEHESLLCMYTQLLCMYNFFRCPLAYLHDQLLAYLLTLSNHCLCVAYNPSKSFS